MKPAWELSAIKAALKPSLQATLYVLASIEMKITTTTIASYKSFAEATNYPTVRVKDVASSWQANPHKN